MLDLISFVIFILVIAILIYRDRAKVKRDGILLIRRTKKGRNFIDNVAKSHKKFWNYFTTFGIIIAIIALIIATVYILNASFDVATKKTKEGAVRLLLPGPVSSPVGDVPAVFIMPWWIWVIGVIIVMIPHEFMHGIACRIENIRIKSVGWLLLLFIPGAFVEQDDEQLKKKKVITKLKVYAAGSFANIVVAFIILIMLSFSQPSPIVGSSFALINNSPAYNASLAGAITEIDGKVIHSASDMNDALLAHKPYDVVEIKTARTVDAIPIFNFNVMPDPAFVADMKNITVHKVALGNHPNETGRAYLGVYGQSFVPVVESSIFLPIYQVMFWAFLFSLGIGLVNLLPIKPLDGGLIMEEIVCRFVKGRKGKNIVKAVSILLLMALLFNIIGPILLSL
ncbi:MAG: site-2 protease family protein [Candidatus Aenigmatarchaeota archaeon]